MEEMKGGWLGIWDMMKQQLGLQTSELMPPPPLQKLKCPMAIRRVTDEHDARWETLQITTGRKRKSKARL